MPIPSHILAKVRPAWRRVTIEGLGDVEVRTPTVADAAKIPAPGWWINAVRCTDGTPLLPEGMDVRELDAMLANAIAEAVMQFLRDPQLARRLGARARVPEAFRPERLSAALAPLTY
jgi:glycosyltransferase involved in cell wall biosynthesis